MHSMFIDEKPMGKVLLQRVGVKHQLKSIAVFSPR